MPAAPHSFGLVEVEKTCSDTSPAPGATPGKLWSVPATMPATWVPCWQASPRSHGWAEPAPVCTDPPLGQEPFEKHAS